MVDALEKMLSYVVIAVVLIVVVLLAITLFQPYLGSDSQLQNVLVDPISVVYENIPCMINCYTDLMGDEVALLSQRPFNDVDDAPFLMNWFPCNNKVMTIAVLINEMVKWDWDYSEGELEPGDLADDFYDNAVELLYTCITAPYDEPKEKCTREEMSFYYFCQEDSYLTSYGFIPCGDRRSFIDYLNTRFLLFAHRTGRDIDNDFICDSSIGDAYNPPYALCTPEDNSKYDENDCKPVWQILDEQEEESLSERKLAKGRCEDFALLYYSLFRSIGVEPDDMHLNLGYCDLPCPCKELLSKIKHCGFEYEKEYCFVPASLSFSGDLDEYENIDSCEGVQGLPKEEGYRGRFNMRIIDEGIAYFWVIQQNFTGSNSSPIYRRLSLDGDYDNDIWWTDINGLRYESRDVDYEETYLGLNARYGLEVSVDLEGCEDNNTVIFYIGFEDEDGPDQLTYYLLTDGETRGVTHEGPLTGDTRYGTIIGNTDCDLDDEYEYDIDSGTEGLIIQDACSEYYTDLSIDHSLEGLIDACSVYLEYGRDANSIVDVDLDIIPDILDALNCSPK
jgi:hypothetical protein